MISWIPDQFDRKVALAMILIALAELTALALSTDYASATLLGGDALHYQTFAVNLIDRGQCSLDATPPYGPTLFRTPGYPLFLASVYRLCGRSPVPVRVLQLALLAATAWFLYRLAARLVGRPAAVWAGLLCLVYPPFVFQTMWHLTETLSTFLAVLLIYGLVRLGDEVRDRTGHAIAFAVGTGLVAGYSALVRPSMAPLVLPSLALMIAAQPAPSRKRSIVLSAVVLSAFLACLVPWSVRNTLLARRFIPLATGQGVSLFVSAKQYVGEIPYNMQDVDWRRFIKEDQRRREVARQALVASGARFESYDVGLLKDDTYRQDAIRTFRTLTPLAWIRSVPFRLVYLWKTTNTSPWMTGAFHRFVQATHVALMALVLIGAWSSRRSILRQWPLWVVPAFLTAVHLVFHVESRYSFPARPFLMPYAGIALARFTHWPARRVGE